MQKVARISFFIVLSWLMVVSPVRAADLNAIKSQVEQRVEERQNQVEQGVFNTASSSAPAASEPDHGFKRESKVFWSIWGGKLKLQSVNGQLYLSLFS